MRPRSTFLRLFLGNLLVMLAVIALGGLVAYQRLDGRYQQDARENQERLARFATEHFRELWPLDSPQIDRICKQLFDDPSVRLTVIAPDGVVLGESSQDPRTMANHRTDDRPEVLAALNGKADSDERTSPTKGVPYRYMARPLVHQGKVAAAVRVAVPVKTIAETESVLRYGLLWSALAGAAMAVLLGLLVSWVWYAPLRRLALAARRIASGDLSRKVRVPGAGELADLANSLNEMRQGLGRQLALAASREQDLQNVLTTMREGVIATDAQGQIVLMNPAAGALLSADPKQAIGRPLQAVAPLELLDLHNRVTAAQKPLSAQFERVQDRPRRTLDVQGTVSAGASSIRCVLVMRDVTDLASAAAMKAQFVANASHELRTPLATIRAAVDSLAAVNPGDPQEVMDLAAVLDRHVARLENMTKDLLDLHMAESARFPLRLQDIPLGQLAAWVQAQFDGPAKAKGLTLTVAAVRPEHPLRTDRKLVDLILRNLLENAIKFTPTGGQVRCAFEVTDLAVILRVEDTGCGIRPEDQPRVFERFFQSDAAPTGDSRTRGTGLGLAIVKHAAERLGARIDLRSEPARGTTVTVTLPAVAGQSL